MGVFRKIRKKENVQVLQIYKGADILQNSAIGKFDRAPTSLVVDLRKIGMSGKKQKLRKNGRYE
jgi:hypothetical protein